MLTKELLAGYVYSVAQEEDIIHSHEQARDLESKIRSWDQVTFDRVLKKRSASLRDMASGTKEGFFDASCYASQVNTIDKIIQSLPQILASN